VLITKFGKAGKTECSVLLFRIVQFRQFQNMNMTGARLKDLKIKDVLRPGKILKGGKEPMEKKSKLKAKVAKIGMSGFGNRSVQFFQIKYSPSRV
jgi:hypothetical protein